MLTLLWFRTDLRLTDNPALAAAVATGGPVVPFYILDDEDAGEHRAGSASRWWLDQSLRQLAGALIERGSSLVLRRGPAEVIVLKLIAETGASRIYWNRRYEPWSVRRDSRLKARLVGDGFEVRTFNAGLLHEPSALRTRAGEPFRVFTPFWKALRAVDDPPRPLPAPDKVPGPASLPESDDLASWDLRPTKPDWAGGIRAAWEPGERSAQAGLDRFLEGPLFDYAEGRNLPDRGGTSRLSPHLHFGEIGPRQIWHAVIDQSIASGKPVDRFLSELAWREFSHHLLFHFPSLPDAPFKSEFTDFPWRTDPEGMTAWRQGATGYPIVDAGMRELWNTGWVHNRVRMIVASFLVKDLLVDWREGEKWFWDTLVDADLANNAASWQWVAGCGTDAAPYFRVFNPALQGAKFDADGAYVRRWVPEIANLPNAVIHKPWTAAPLDLLDAGIALGKTYPLPVVDHDAARLAALRAYERIRRGRS
jgi:deoxyribodipyrimidine photo-lyase